MKSAAPFDRRSRFIRSGSALRLPARRWHPGLSFKMLSIATLPVLLAGLLVALLMTAQRTASLSSASRSLADSVARILATTLDVHDVALVSTQLQAAVSSQSVAFVDVLPGDHNLRFFVSKDQDSDWYLRRAYDSALAADPGQRLFRFTDGRAEAYRQAAQQLAQVGPLADQASARAHLEEAAARYQASQGQISEFQVVRMQVYELPSGQRRLRAEGEAPSDQAQPPGALLFTLGIGVSNQPLSAMMNRELLLVLLACGLVAIGAALIALWSARRLVRPILGVTQAAGRISLGDIDTPVDIVSDDETGELAQSVERLRVSLQLALRRLRPGQEG
ncbi:HAMP domain-containing protein [Deinococcus sp.]|uniref:HAMP domain-containing protein n=1 Tax=Deinococcus sp. TaxID=47478 RepID=UPI003B598832